MDDVLCNYTAAYKAQKLTLPEMDFPQSQYGFFAGLEPIEDAINTVETLQNCEAFEVYILTAPSIFNPFSYAEKRVWVEKHLGFEFVKKLIISPNKGLLKGDYLIDDQDQGNGQDLFEGMLLKFNSDTFPNWSAIKTFLLNKSEDS